MKAQTVPYTDPLRRADSDAVATAARHLEHVREAVCKALRQSDLQTATALLKAEDVALAELRKALRCARGQS